MNKRQRKAAVIAKRRGQQAHRIQKRRAKTLAKLLSPGRRFTFAIGETVIVDRFRKMVGVVVRLNPTIVRMPDGTEHDLDRLLASNYV